jgi:hypothetical protein
LRWLQDFCENEPTPGYEVARYDILTAVSQIIQSCCWDVTLWVVLDSSTERACISFIFGVEAVKEDWNF